MLLPHGVNLVAKQAPYYPSAGGFGEDDAVWLKDNGFDVVRLGLTATGLMPTPGHIDNALLDRYAATVDMLAAHKIYVLVDLHQDGWGERANGQPLGSDGFPEWMTLTKGALNTHTGFPLYYVTNPAIQQAFQSLWDNDLGPDGVPLQATVATMFGAFGRALRRQPVGARVRRVQRAVAGRDMVAVSRTDRLSRPRTCLPRRVVRRSDAAQFARQVPSSSCSASRSCCSTSEPRPRSSTHRAETRTRA